MLDFGLEIFAIKYQYWRNVGSILEIQIVIYSEALILQKYWFSIGNICNKTRMLKNV